MVNTRRAGSGFELSSTVVLKASAFSWQAMSYHVDTKTAKEQYFLTTADLSRLPYESGGWGYGRARFYDPADLKELALEKYGEQGLMAKRQARQQKVRGGHVWCFPEPPV